MSDLVERLREMRPRSYGPEGLHGLIGEAIMEIEQLRRNEKSLRDLIQAYSDMAKSR